MQIPVHPQAAKRVPLAHQVMHARGICDFATAERLSDQLLQGKPDAADVRRGLARTLLETGRREAASDHWRALLRQDAKGGGSLKEARTALKMCAGYFDKASVVPSHCGGGGLIRKNAMRSR